MKRAVYLAGSIEGISEEDAKSWRQQASNFFKIWDIETRDPTRRVAYRAEDGRNAMNRIVKMDLQDISECNVILVDLRDSTPGRKWGTVCEIAHAHTKNKIIIVIQDEGQWIHPFVGFYATEIHTDFEVALKAAAEYFK